MTSGLCRSRQIGPSDIIRGSIETEAELTTFDCRNLRTHHVLSDRKCSRLKLRLTEGQFSTDTRGKLSLVLCVCGATGDSPGVRHLPFLCIGCSMIEMVLDVHVVLPETFVRHDISQCCRLGHNDQDGLFELVKAQTAVLIGTTALFNDFVFVSFRSGIWRSSLCLLQTRTCQQFDQRYANSRQHSVRSRIPGGPAIEHHLMGFRSV